MLNDLIKYLEEKGVRLTQGQLADQLKFFDELLKWNKKVNLTAITDRHDVIEKHLYDCLIVNRYLGNIGSLADIGSGGGLPAIPLAILRPEVDVTSVESIGKKVNFQKHIKRTLHLENLTIYGDRAEGLVEKGVKFDVVISRAFSSLKKFIDIGFPLLSEGGTLLAMKGPEGRQELNDFLTDDTDKLLFEVEIIEYVLPFSQSSRNLIRINKCQSHLNDRG